MNVANETSAPANGTKPEAVQPAKSKILLVDDNPAIRQLLLRLLAEEDYQVQTAANGGEALELAHATPFDLVLLDLNMPVKNGWETFEQLTAKNPLLPVILITARPKQFSSVPAPGVSAWLEKPLDFAKLLHTIRNLLAEPAAARLARVAKRSAVQCFPSLQKGQA